MSEVVTVLHRFDIGPAAGLAEQLGARIFAIDPVMHGRITGANLPAPLVHTRAQSHVALGAWQAAERDTVALCKELGSVLASVTTPAAAQSGWCAHRLFHMFWTLHGYRQLWPDAVKAVKADHWRVVMPQLPHAYGTNSFMPALLLIEELIRQGVQHTLYSYECPGLDSFQLPDLRQLPDATPDILCHLPTCGHDAAYIAQELRESGLSFALLSPQMYDADFGGLPATGLVDVAEVRAMLGAEAMARVEALSQPLRDILRRHLAPHVKRSHFIDMQVQSLWEALEVQLVFYLWLEQRLGTRPPRQLLISNHDATVHGALMSFAQAHGAAIKLLPHSRVYNVAIRTDGLAPLCLHHGLQDGPTLDMAHRQLPSGRLAYPGAWTPPDITGHRELRTVGLVLNGISANGMCLVDFERYVDGVREIIGWARHRGLVLKLRVRTAETPVLLVAERLQLDVNELMQHVEGSLLDFARGCDLVLGYDVPTSGLQDLVRQGIAVLQGEFRPLARFEWGIVDARVIPRYNLPETLERLAVLQANPALFHEFRQEQFALALKSQQGAQPLRHWLQQRA